jgi:hypothetical protein
VAKEVITPKKAYVVMEQWYRKKGYHMTIVVAVEKHTTVHVKFAANARFKVNVDYIQNAVTKTAMMQY